MHHVMSRQGRQDHAASRMPSIIFLFGGTSMKIRLVVSVNKQYFNQRNFFIYSILIYLVN